MNTFFPNIGQPHQKIKRFVKLFLYGLIVSSCANVVSPSGGPVDKTPPEVIQSSPENYSVFYQGQRIRIWFDEFVKLDNITQKLLVSPPMGANPEIRLKGKSVIIEPADTFRANTTYSFFFADAIKDITENNPIPGFTFVVSTGSYVDSLSVKGIVMDAWTMKPVDLAYVMLYDDLNNSVPIKEKPIYISQTDKQGMFSIKNLRPGTYRMFALLDLNYNFLFDQPNEQIAFLDTFISPVYEPPLKRSIKATDSISIDPANTDQKVMGTGMDSLQPKPSRKRIENEPKDTMGGDIKIMIDSLDTNRIALPTDSVHSDSISDTKPDFLKYTLYMFEHKDERQALLSSTYSRKGLLSLTFKLPVDSLHFNDLEGDFHSSPRLIEYNITRDTLFVWMPELNQDSLKTVIMDKAKEIDTLRMALKLRTQSSGGRQRTSSSATDSILTIKPMFASGVVPWFSKLGFVCSSPLNSIQKDKFIMYEDSVVVPLDILFPDSLKRKFNVAYELKKEKSYIIEMLPGFVTDIFGFQNDTIKIQMKTDTETSYGSLDLNITLPGDASYIFHLTDDKGGTIVEKTIESSGVIHFTNLKEGKYGMRLIMDENGNGKWDPGHYLKGLQPEKVYISGSPAQVRANWDTEATWDVNGQKPINR